MKRSGPGFDPGSIGREAVREYATLGERTLLFTPDAVYHVGINGDYSPTRRERFERSLGLVLCSIVGHRWIPAQEYRRVPVPSRPDGGELLADWIEVVRHPVYYVRHVRRCERCCKVLPRFGNCPGL